MAQVLGVWTVAPELVEHEGAPDPQWAKKQERLSTVEKSTWTPAMDEAWLAYKTTAEINKIGEDERRERGEDTSGDVLPDLRGD